MFIHPMGPFRAALLALIVALAGAHPAGAQAGSVEIKRFTPERSNVLLEPSTPPAVDPRGNVFFVIVNGRLLTTVDAVTGAYKATLDLGVEAGAAIDASPRVPLSLSSDGSILAVPVGGRIRFFDVDREGALTPISEYATPTGAAVPVYFSDDNELAIFASGPSGAVATVRVRSGKRADSIPLSSDETPIATLSDARSRIISVVTRRNVLIFRYTASGKLEQTGAYRRETTSGDLYSGILTRGRRGRGLFTVEEGGSAIVGLNIRNAKQTARETPDPRERFAPPLATSPDEFTIVVTAVSATTGQPSALYFYKAKGRGLAKDKPKTLAIPEAWGHVGRLMFDPSGSLLLATFPETQRIALIDPNDRQILDDTQVVGSPGGVTFHPDGRSILVAGSASSDPLAPGAPGAVTLIPIVRRELSDATVVRFSSLPGVLFTAADRAFTFPNKSHAVVSSGAADTIYTFNVFSLGELARLDVGPSTGFMALAPDGRTLVVSGRGGVMVVRVEDTGALTVIGQPAVGAVPHDLAPSVSFHPSLPLAYVTSGDSVWRVDLVRGRADRFRVGNPPSNLSNPRVSASGGRLYVIQDLDTLIRLELDGEGTPAVLNSIGFEATLDPRAPRVAYDDDGLRMWVVDDGVVRQFDLLLGFETGVSERRETGRYPLVVGPGLLAVFPSETGPIALYSIVGGRPVFAGEIALGGVPFAPLGGGTPGLDSESETLYLPMPGASKIVGLELPAGSPEEIDGSSSAVHVWALPGGGQLAYPDISRFPGSAVVANIR